MKRSIKNCKQNYIFAKFLKAIKNCNQSTFRDYIKCEFKEIDILFNANFLKLNNRFLKYIKLYK